MGCDIHAYEEVRFRDRWVMIGEIAIRRDYRFFASLAGVRGEGPAPKPWPDDASDGAEWHLERWSSDAHTAGWCTPEEAMAAMPTRGHEYADFVAAQDRGSRILFFFDN